MYARVLYHVVTQCLWLRLQSSQVHIITDIGAQQPGSETIVSISAESIMHRTSSSVPFSSSTLSFNSYQAVV